MASAPLVQGSLLGAPVSCLGFDQREFVKTPSPSPENSPEKEDATRVELDLAALDTHGEPRKMVEETDAGDKAKAAIFSDIVSPAAARDKEEAIHGEYGTLDYFDVLDMLGKEGFGIDDGGDLTGKPKAKAAAVVKKHPVGCRQRNVVRPSVRIPLDTEVSEDIGPDVLKDGAILKEFVDKQRAEAEARRLEYLRNAR